MGPIQFNQLQFTPDGKELIINASVKAEECLSDVYIDEIIIENIDKIDTLDDFSIPSNNPVYRKQILSKEEEEKNKTREELISDLKNKYEDSSEVPESIRGEDDKLDESKLNDLLDNDIEELATEAGIELTKMVHKDTKETGTLIITEQDFNYQIDNENSEVIENDDKCKCKKHFKRSNTLELKKSKFDTLLFVYVKIKGTPCSDAPCGMDNTYTMQTVVNLYPFYQESMNYIKEIADNCRDRCETPTHFVDYILKLRALEISIKTGNYEDAIYYYKKFFMKTKEETQTNKRKTGGCCCGNS